MWNRHFALLQTYIFFFSRFFCKDPERHIIKRIVGLEGDVIRNNKYSSREVVIPTGHCWVEGDNPAASQDSIKYGPSKWSFLNYVNMIGEYMIFFLGGGTKPRIMWPTLQTYLFWNFCSPFPQNLEAGGGAEPPLVLSLMIKFLLCWIGAM